MIIYFIFLCHVEKAVMLSKLNAVKHHIEFGVSLEELGFTSAEAKTTYEKDKKRGDENYQLSITVAIIRYTQLATLLIR